MKSKLAIVIGHTEHAEGATGLFTVPQGEWAFNSTEIAPIMLAHGESLGLDCRIFDKTEYKDYPAVGHAVDAWIGAGKGCAIELHFNSATPAAYGTETLYDTVPSSNTKLATIIQKKMVECFHRVGKGDRGIKNVDHDRGGYAMRSHQTPSCIVEPTFAGSNVSEANLLWEKRSFYSRALVQGVVEFLKQA